MDGGRPKHKLCAFRISGCANAPKCDYKSGSLYSQSIGVPRSSACSNIAPHHGRKPSVIINGKCRRFCVLAAREKRTKGHVCSDSARSPHRTAKPSRGCLPLAHPRALPAVIHSDRRSPSAMCEFPFEYWGVTAAQHTRKKWLVAKAPSPPLG